MAADCKLRVDDEGLWIITMDGNYGPIHSNVVQAILNLMINTHKDFRVLNNYELAPDILIRFASSKRYEHPPGTAGTPKTAPSRQEED